MTSRNEVIMKQPVRKVFRQGMRNSIYLTLPPELEIKPGDEVYFKVEEGKIILEKIDRGEEGNERD